MRGINLIKNYIIGGLCGYIVIKFSFWEFNDISQPIMIWAVTMCCVAWMLYLIDEDIRKLRRRRYHRNHEVRKTVTYEYLETK